MLYNQATRLLSGVAAIAVLGAATSVAAQTAPETGGATIDEIIVTATKREQSLQDTAIAVTALGGEQLEAIGATEFEDYFRLVPGLQAIDRGPGQKKYILRGVNSENAKRLAPIVQQYLDEFPLTLTAGEQSDIRLYDIERVEVLRGPQGTLYGAGSMGGTIRTLTRKPDLDEFSVEMDGTASVTEHGGDSYQGYAVVNAPLATDKFGVRLLAFGEDHSGFIDNVANGRDDINGMSVWGGRLQARWRPVDDLTFDLMVLHQELKAGGLNEHMPGFLPPARPSYLPPFAPWFPALSSPLGDLETYKSIDERTKDINTIVNLQITGDMGWAELTSSSTYYKHRLLLDLDITELLGFGGLIVDDNTTETLGQELRLSDSKGAFKWVAGGFLMASEQTPSSAEQAVFFPGRELFFSQGSSLEQVQTALFAEGSYEVTPQLTATIGGRWANFNLDSSGILLGGTAPDGAPVGSVSGPYEVSESKVTYKFQLEYRPNDDTLVYATASSGFRPGGFNDVAFSPILNPNGTIPRQYKSDSLWNYELGAKLTLLDNRASFNTALFYIDWTDIQVTAYDAVTTAIAYTANASQARIYGLEAELAFALTPELRLGASGAYTDAALSEDQPGADLASGRGGAPGLKGDRLPNVPKWSGALSADYDTEFASGLKGFANATLSYTGKSATYFRPNDPLYRVQDDYLLTNLRFGVGRDNWRVTAFVQNLTDERAELFVNNLSGWDKVNVNRPRTWGLSVNTRF